MYYYLQKNVFSPSISIELPNYNNLIKPLTPWEEAIEKAVAAKFGAALMATHVCAKQHA
jgi:hypothetical protein